ncbi:MAG: DNA polymerase Y family protein [Chloroflexi bacterium]|nr:DNA polymerase Y family protein [Chloroflexota bacterium]
MPIACVHFPRFAIEVERQRRPDITARLLLIGEATVFDCSLGAEASGVRRGRRMSEAIGLCQKALVLPPDLPHYQRRSEELLDFLEGYSPEVQAGPSLGTAYLSLSGLSLDLQPFAEELIASLHRRTGFMASLGVAGGKFAARVAAQTTRPGLAKVVPPGEEAAFLALLPIDYLAYGVAPAGEAMRWRLQLLGLETMGDIARLPLGAFQQQFGPEGKRCWELARGIDDDPLVPRVKEETVVRRLQLPAPAVALEAILASVERLVYAAYGDVDRKGRWVRKAAVRAVLDDGGAWELPVPFREALADPRDAWFAVKSAVARRPPQRPVEELEVELVGLVGESGKQAGMFEGKGKLWRQVGEAVRQVRVQEAGVSIGKVVEVEPWSRIPERRMALLEFEP